MTELFRKIFQKRSGYRRVAVDMSSEFDCTQGMADLSPDMYSDCFIGDDIAIAAAAVASDEIQFTLDSTINSSLSQLNTCDVSDSLKVPQTENDASNISMVDTPVIINNTQIISAAKPVTKRVAPPLTFKIDVSDAIFENSSYGTFLAAEDSESDVSPISDDDDVNLSLRLNIDSSSLSHQRLSTDPVYSLEDAVSVTTLNSCCDSEKEKISDETTLARLVNGMAFMQSGSHLVCLTCFPSVTLTSHPLIQWRKYKLAKDGESVQLRNGETLFQISDVWSVKACSDDALAQMSELFNITHMSTTSLKSLAFTIEFRDSSFMTFIADSFTNAYLWFRGIQSLINPHRFVAEIQISDYLRIGSVSVMDFLSNPINDNNYLFDMVLTQLNDLQPYIRVLALVIDKHCNSDCEFDSILQIQMSALLDRWDIILKYSHECELICQSEITQFREQWLCLLSDITAVTIKVSQF